MSSPLKFRGKFTREKEKKKRLVDVSERQNTYFCCVWTLQGKKDKTKIRNVL